MSPRRMDWAVYRAVRSRWTFAKGISVSVPAGPCTVRRSTRPPATSMARWRGARTGFWSRTFWDTGQPTRLIQPGGAAALLTVAGEMVGTHPRHPSHVGSAPCSERIAWWSHPMPDGSAPPPRHCAAGRGHPPRLRLMRQTGGVVVVPVDRPIVRG